MDDLLAHHQSLWNYPASRSQVQAWRDEYATMHVALKECWVASPDAARGWSVVFEFELPLEGGRRADVVVLAGSTLVVIEYKSTGFPLQADVDQAWGYARDLTDYHRASHSLMPYPILTLVGAPAGFAGEHDGAVVTAPDNLSRYLFHAATEGSVNLPEWLDAPYEPLPSLIEAARRIFRDEPLPHVKQALAAGVPETVELLGRIVDEAAESGQRILAFVTGVPGAGKTLVGLRLVYERTQDSGRATFLSGNGPLVQVLQDALKSRAFVRDLHAYIRTYGLSQQKRPTENVVVFDEAQRAWDQRYMTEKRGVEASEPDLLLDIGQRISNWSTLVGLVGHGQEIHSGEEAGMQQWAEAARRPVVEPWKVHCPPELVNTFSGLDVVAHDELDLTLSLRSRRADELHHWVHLLLEGSLPLARRQAARLEQPLFPMYVTRDLDEAKAYVRRRYEDEPGRRYGLVASSHAKILPAYGVSNGYMATSRMNIAKWFNAEPDDPLSCCALTQPVTEFGCQGLELDVPIVCWGEDHTWTGQAWALSPIRRKYPQDDPHQLLRNAYRVLLTRGRDGIVVFLPDDRRLDLTEHALLAAGVRPLPAEDAVLQIATA